MAPRINSAPHFNVAPRPGEAHAVITPRFGAAPRLGTRSPVEANHWSAPAARTGRDGAWAAGESGRDSAWRGHTSTWNARDPAWHGHDSRSTWIAQPRWNHPHHSWYGPKWGYHPYWHGGWWQGSYWPRAYYGWSFPWYLAVLPAGCATFWWSGVPYYYVNNVYYVWSADDSGYIVSDPPPVGSATTNVSATVDSDDSAIDDSAGAVAPAGSDEIYMYPEKGQSDEQQATDRYECHKWAQDQTGFDPTQPNGGSTSATADDYRRAMIACLDARGYSAK
jgi:hypothetical protein